MGVIRGQGQGEKGSQSRDSDKAKDYLRDYQSREKKMVKNRKSGFLKSLRIMIERLPI
jgi:hypothetical protein